MNLVKPTVEIYSRVFQRILLYIFVISISFFMNFRSLKEFLEI
jgi:hypothetical protein